MENIICKNEVSSQVTRNKPTQSITWWHEASKSMECLTEVNGT